MPYRKLKILAPPALPASLSTIGVASASAAEDVLAHVRVVGGPDPGGPGPGHRHDIDQSDPNAVCFGPGTGGSGNSVTLQGANALGIVKDASQTDSALLPISITDYYYSSYGSLGVCGFGGYQASGSSFWYVKVNHTGLQVGATNTR